MASVWTLGSNLMPIIVVATKLLGQVDSGEQIGARLKFGTMHGVAPDVRRWYFNASAGESFWCLDQSSELPGAYVNDNFCDCSDGSDEPGTAACAGISGAQFFCRNRHSFPMLVPTSRVRDGICDCCDGSDEIGMDLCNDTCKAEGASLRTKLENTRKEFEEGLRMREAMKAETAEKVNSWHSEKKQLEQDMARMEKRRAEMSPAGNTSENHTNSGATTERVLFEEDFDRPGATKRWNVVEKGGATIYRDVKRGKVLAMNSCTWGGMAFSKASFACSPGSECKISFWAKGAPWQGFSRRAKKTLEELADAHSWLAVPKPNEDYPDRLAPTDISSEWSHYEYEFPDQDSFQMFGSDKIRFSTSPVHIMLQAHTSTGRCGSTMFDDFRVESLGQPPVNRDAPNSTAANDIDKPAVSEYAKWALDEKPASSQESMLQEGKENKNEQLAWDSFSLDNLTIDDLDRRLRTAKGRRLSLESKLNHASGEAGLRWAPLIDRCVSENFDGYSYTLCFFDRAKQGSGSMSLGSFDGWDREGKQVMTFANGVLCHGGPRRSLKAHLVCGVEERIIEFSEPSRCVYEAQVATPIACDADGLREVEEEIHKLSAYSQEVHDEL